jgi:hypothetical protein
MITRREFTGSSHGPDCPDGTRRRRHYPTWPQARYVREQRAAEIPAQYGMNAWCLVNGRSAVRIRSPAPMHGWLGPVSPAARNCRACPARGAIVAVAPQPGLDATRRNRCPLVTTGQALASSYRARRRSRYFSRLYPGIDQLMAFR